MDGTIKQIYVYALKYGYKIKVERVRDNIYRVLAEKEYFELALKDGSKMGTTTIDGITSSYKTLIDIGSVKIVGKEVKFNIVGILLGEE